MNKQRDSEILRKRGERAQKKLDVALSTQFRPRFLQDADSRIAIVRTIRKRIALLKEHAGGEESYMREMLCEHAVFMHVRLETLETQALEGGDIDWGTYTQAVNCLCGLLARLGLEKRIKSAGSLSLYLAEKKNGNGSK